MIMSGIFSAFILGPDLSGCSGIHKSTIKASFVQFHTNGLGGPLAVWSTCVQSIIAPSHGPAPLPNGQILRKGTGEPAQARAKGGR